VKPFVIEKVLSEDGQIIYQHNAAIACHACDGSATEQQTNSTPDDAEAQLGQLFNELQAADTADDSNNNEPVLDKQQLAPQVISEHNAFLIADALTISV